LSALPRALFYPIEAVFSFFSVEGCISSFTFVFWRAAQRACLFASATSDSLDAIVSFLPSNPFRAQRRLSLRYWMRDPPIPFRVTRVRFTTYKSSHVLLSLEREKRHFQSLLLSSRHRGGRAVFLFFLV